MSFIEYRRKWHEEWKVCEIPDIPDSHHYKISDFGKMISYKRSESGETLKFSTIKGYKAVSLKDFNNRRVKKYVHKLVAMHFLPEPSEDQKYVIHLDYNKTNNYYKNLRWATEKEKNEHLHKVHVFTNRKEKITRSKLNIEKIQILRRKINDPDRKTRLKMIARQFGISENHLYRIKRGEQWKSEE